MSKAWALFSFFLKVYQGQAKLFNFCFNLPNTEPAVKTKQKLGKSFSFIFHYFLTIYVLSVILWLDKEDFPENVHTVCQY